MILVDAHVHFHDCYAPDSFLGAAFKNFSRRIEAIQWKSDWTGVLLLAQSCLHGGIEEFQRKVLKMAASSESQTDRKNRWTIVPTREKESWSISRSNGYTLYILFGEQIRTAENLEVLALATRHHFQNDLTMMETIQSVQASGAMAVLPWGVGKWLGQRGKIIEAIVARNDTGRFFLGDNSGRPMLWRRIKLFELAESQGISILPGSDPLPFQDGYTKVGSYGFSMQGRIDSQRPSGHLKEMLMQPRIELEAFGERERLPNFVVNQLKMQLRKLSTPWPRPIRRKKRDR